MTDRLSKGEIRKDAVQEGFTAATHTVGAVAGIIVGAVGGFATELFEIRDSARRAGRDHDEDGPAEPLDEGQPKDI